MQLVQTIETEITPTLKDNGYSLVRVAITGAEVKTLQIMAERQDEEDMTVDDCAKISRAISAVLDVADIIPTRYVLEVSSPGLDRPLLKPADYTRFTGQTAKIELMAEMAGRKRFKGILAGFDADTNSVLLNFEGKEIKIAFDSIAKAKLVLTDELLKQHQKKKGK